MQGSAAVSKPMMCSPAAGQQWTLPFPAGDWKETPDSVRLHLLTLLRENDLLAASVTALTTQVAQVEAALQTAQARLRQNSKNSSRPPSSDTPYRRKPATTPADGVDPAAGGAAALQTHPAAHAQPPATADTQSNASQPAAQAATGQAHAQKPSAKAPTVLEPTQLPPPPVAKPAEAPKKKPGAKPGHPGHRQKLLPPDVTVRIAPAPCACGTEAFSSLTVYDQRQQFELRENPVLTTRIELLKGCCDGCGKVGKATLPPLYKTGYGPRFTAFVAEIVGMMGDSRSAVQALLLSVFCVPVSLGTIQKLVDRTSQAILPYYQTIAALARSARIAHFDETPWYLSHRLQWLWVMTNPSVAFFMIHPHRSKKAFLALVDTWQGILVADGYAVYRKWTELRQSCLAHLIRRAEALAQHTDRDIARFGRHAKAELQRLVHMATVPPNTGQWRAFYARFVGLLFRTVERKDEAGTFARTLLAELDHLWLFLEIEGVVPTNNLAERMLRFAVLWRKRSLGTASEKGCRWVERILTLRQTARLRGQPTFPLLVDALRCFFHSHRTSLRELGLQVPRVSWLSRARAVGRCEGERLPGISGRHPRSSGEHPESSPMCSGVPVRAGTGNPAGESERLSPRQTPGAAAHGVVGR